MTHPLHWLLDKSHNPPSVAKYHRSLQPVCVRALEAGLALSSSTGSEASVSASASASASVPSTPLSLGGSCACEDALSRCPHQLFRTPVWASHTLIVNVVTPAHTPV